MKSLKRYLSGTERVFLMGRIPAICILELEGLVRTDILSEALGALAAESPILRSQVAMDDVGPLLRLRSSPPELLVRTDADDPAVTEANTPLDPEQANARFTLYQRGGSSTIALAIAHAFSDGMLLSTLSHRLLEYYGVLANGGTLDVQGSDDFEEPMEALLPTHLEPVDLASAPPLKLRTRADGGGETAAGVHVLRFDKKATDQILAASTKAGLTPLGLLSGCIAAAVCAECGDGKENTVAVWCLVNMRNRLEREVAADAGIFCAGMTILSLRGDGSRPDPIHLGHQAVAQLNAALAEQVPQRMVPTLANTPPDRFPQSTFALSNIGRYPEPRLPEGLRLIAHRGIVVSSGPAPTLIVITTGGRLSMDITYHRALFTHEQIVTWGNRIRSALIDAAAQAEAPVSATA